MLTFIEIFLCTALFVKLDMSLSICVMSVRVFCNFSQAMGPFKLVFDINDFIYTNNILNIMILQAIKIYSHKVFFYNQSYCEISVLISD